MAKNKRGSCCRNVEAPAVRERCLLIAEGSHALHKGGNSCERRKSAWRTANNLRALRPDEEEKKLGEKGLLHRLITVACRF